MSVKDYGYLCAVFFGYHRQCLVLLNDTLANLIVLT